VFQKSNLFVLLITFFSSILSAENILHRSLEPQATFLNPLLHSDWYGNILKRDLFEGLMTRDREGNIIYGNAKSVDIDKEKISYLFTLKEDAKWSNGTDVTAYDYEASYRYAINPLNHTESASYLQEIHIKNALQIFQNSHPIETLGVRAISKKKLLIELEKPLTYFLNTLASPFMAPQPKYCFKNNVYQKNLFNIPISNGAYMIHTLIKDKKIILVKNPYYYDNKNTSIDKIFYHIASGTEALKLYENNQLDIITDIPKNRISDIKKKIAKEYSSHLIHGNYFLSFNLSKKIFQDKKIRKALFLAVDRELLATKVMGSGEKALYNFIPTSLIGISSQKQFYEKLTQKKREDMAKNLLLKAGYNLKNPLKFELLYNENEYNTRTLLAVISMWKKVFEGSIKVKLIPKPWEIYMSELKNYPISRIGWVADYVEGGSMLSILNTFNPFFTDRKLSQKLHNRITSITSENSKEKRNKMYKYIDRDIIEEFIFIPLFQFSSNILIKPYVHGYKSNKLDAIFSKYLSVDKH
jgi:oligopeptide transport system substrate-binding protein